MDKQKDKVEQLDIRSQSQEKEYQKKEKLESEKQPPIKWPKRQLYKSGIVQLTEFGYKCHPAYQVYSGTKLHGKQVGNQQHPQQKDDHAFEQLRSCALEALKGFQTEIKSMLNVPNITSDPLEVLSKRMEDRIARLHRDIVLCFDGYQMKNFSVAERRLEEERLKHGDDYYAKYHSLKRDYQFLLERSAMLGNTMQRLEQSEMQNQKLKAQIDILEKQLELFRNTITQVSEGEENIFQDQPIIEKHNQILKRSQIQESKPYNINNGKNSALSNVKQQSRLQTASFQKRTTSPQQKNQKIVQKSGKSIHINKNSTNGIKANVVGKNLKQQADKPKSQYNSDVSSQYESKQQSVHFSDLPEKLEASIDQTLDNKMNQSNLTEQSLLDIQNPSIISMYGAQNSNPMTSQFQQMTTKSLNTCSLFLNDQDPNLESSDINFLQKHNNLLQQQLNFEQQRTEKLREESQQLLHLQRLHYERIRELEQSQYAQQKALSMTNQFHYDKQQSEISNNIQVNTERDTQPESKEKESLTLQKEVDRLKEELIHKDKQLVDVRKELGVLIQELQGLQEEKSPKRSKT